MVLGRKLLWYTCEAVQIDLNSPRAADLVVVVTFWRSPVISSYATDNVECCSSSCKSFIRRDNLWFLRLCLRGCSPSSEHVSVTLSRPLNLAMNQTALCRSISRDSISLANVGSNTVSAYSALLVGLVLECAWMLPEFSKLCLSLAPCVGQIWDLTVWQHPGRLSCQSNPLLLLLACMWVYNFGCRKQWLYVCYHRMAFPNQLTIFVWHHQCCSEIAQHRQSCLQADPATINVSSIISVKTYYTTAVYSTLSGRSLIII